MSGRVVVLTGGVGGAKLVLGLARMLAPGDVTAVVNTGDDFTHLGLAISPDIDTLLYTLSGKANAVQGWGRADETWTFMATLTSLNGPGWFQLGDGDVALHVWRTAQLANGRSLSQVTASVAAAWDVGVRVLPMTDDPVATMLATDEGILCFQDYFVARQCRPVVSEIRFDGADVARPAPGVVEAITAPDLRAILIAPSNPFLSVDPILAVPGIRDALSRAVAPVVAVSPLVGNDAVKGPTAKLMREMGVPTAASAIVRHYGSVLDAILVDESSAQASLDIPFDTADTMMRTLDDRIRVARAALALADRLRRPWTG